MDNKEEERRRKISKAKTGSKHSEETKAKIASALTGREVSEAARNNMRIAKLGRKHSQAHKDAIAQGQRLRLSIKRGENKT